MQMQEDMIRTIAQHVRDTAAEIGREELSPRLIAALRKVPRDRFVPQGEARFTFSDSPLPIGHGQTISQPFIVALMTELIDPQPGYRVLEVGSGSGYQAAILGELVSDGVRHRDRARARAPGRRPAARARLRERHREGRRRLARLAGARPLRRHRGHGRGRGRAGTVEAAAAHRRQAGAAGGDEPAGRTWT